MKVYVESGNLCLSAGFFQGVTRVPLQELRQWTLCREESGATYLAFAIKGATQHVSFLPEQAPALLNKLALIEQLTGLPPHFALERPLEDGLEWVNYQMEVVTLGQLLDFLDMPGGSCSPD